MSDDLNLDIYIIGNNGVKVDYEDDSTKHNPILLIRDNDTLIRLDTKISEMYDSEFASIAINKLKISTKLKGRSAFEIASYFLNHGIFDRPKYIYLYGLTNFERECIKILLLKVYKQIRGDFEWELIK